MSEQKQKCGCSHYILKWYEQLSVIFLVFMMLATALYGGLEAKTAYISIKYFLCAGCIYAILMYYLLVHLKTKDVCLGHEEEEYW